MATTELYNRVDREKSGDRSEFLRRVIQWDAGIITLGGIIMLAMSGTVATFMGIANPAVLVIGGLMVLLYDGGRLLWATTVNPVDRRLANISFYGNALWAIISLPLLAADLLPLSDGGWWVMAALADFAAVFAVLQWYGRR